MFVYMQKSNRSRNFQYPASLEVCKVGVASGYVLHMMLRHMVHNS